jgi:protein-S-isoprenylcysteine O-methyltransferase Ste14
MHHLIDYKPPRIAMLMVILAAVLNAAMPLQLHTNLPLVAVLTAALGFAVMMRAWWLFKRVDTAICPTAVATSLVTQDVFSITRNPMYLGIFLMLLALAMVSGVAAYYGAAIAFILLMDRFFCVYEERKSQAEFSDEYVEYAKRVRRWL